MEIWNHGIVFKLQDIRSDQRHLIILNEVFEDFIQFHGDRNYGDDAAIVGGIALFESMPDYNYWSSTWKRYERKCKTQLRNASS